MKRRLADSWRDFNLTFREYVVLSSYNKKLLVNLFILLQAKDVSWLDWITFLDIKWFYFSTSVNQASLSVYSETQWCKKLCPLGRIWNIGVAIRLEILNSYEYALTRSAKWQTFINMRRPISGLCLHAPAWFAPSKDTRGTTTDNNRIKNWYSGEVRRISANVIISTHIRCVY